MSDDRITRLERALADGAVIVTPELVNLHAALVDAVRALGDGCDCSYRTIPAEDWGISGVVLDVECSACKARAALDAVLGEK